MLTYKHFDIFHCGIRDERVGKSDNEVLCVCIKFKIFIL